MWGMRGLHFMALARQMREVTQIWYIIFAGLTGMLLFQTAFAELKQLYTEAKDNHYPDNALFKNVQRAVKDAEKYSCLGKWAES